MKNFLPLLLFVLPLTVWAQTKQVTKEDQAGNWVEKYQVLKADKRIKEGSYKMLGLFQGDLMQEGFYKNNQKDSLWKNYGYPNNLLLEGCYKADQRIGIWTAYNTRKQIQVQYDYTNKKLLFFKPNWSDSTKKYSVISGADTIKSFLDRCPVYLDGTAMFKKTSQYALKYPAEARRAHKEGSVIIAFTIDKDGTLSSYRIVKGLGYGLDEEALSSIKAMPGNWLPGILNGMPVKTEYEVQIAFALNY